jgi:predicted DNA-binding transcriptional regulator AlpA
MTQREKDRRAQQSAADRAIPLNERRAMSAMSVDEFCSNFKISRSKLYQLWRAGRGPKYFQLGTVRRISDAAASDWCVELERECVA